MTGRVAGKVALITGAARGQGRSHAVRLAEEGADVLAVDLCGEYGTTKYAGATAADLDRTRQEVEALGRRIVAVTADVRDAEGLTAAVDDGVATLGRLDVVVANAGICIPQAWDEVTPAAWQDTLDTNLTGVWNTMAAGVPHLIAAGGGSVIAISSTAGLKGAPFFAAYGATKHAIVGLSRTMANELGREFIRFNTVHPAGLDTPLADGLVDMERLIGANRGLGPIFQNAMPVRVVEPVDVSNAVLFLASEESRYVTGLAMTVDAGNTIR